MKIIFLGTSNFASVILEKLANTEYKPDLVITMSDKPAGRRQALTPPSVKLKSGQYSIPVIQPEKIKDCKSKIRNLNPGLGISADYGQIIPKEILEIPQYGFLNVHPSLLPKYRGPSPIQTALLKGEKKTGVTVYLMDEKIDHGPILSQRPVKLYINDTAESLEEKLAKLGSELLIQTIPRWTAGKINPITQKEKDAVLTKMLKKENGKINWKKTAKEIEQQIRAFLPWPGSFTFWQKNNKSLRIIILKAKVYKYPIKKDYSACPAELRRGGKTFLAPRNELCAWCKKSSLVIEELQLEGKKSMKSEEFLRGYPNFVGTILK